MFKAEVDTDINDNVFEYTLDDALDEAGVYVAEGWSPNHAYVVVFPGEKTRFGLFVNSDGECMEMDYDVWSHKMYKKVNIDVTVLLKRGE